MIFFHHKVYFKNFPSFKLTFFKDNATGSVKVTYFSNCLEGGALRQTNKCSGIIKTNP